MFPSSSSSSSSSVCSGVLLLAVCSLLLTCVRSETAADSAISDTQDTMSGDSPGEATTREPFQLLTQQAFTFDYEDATPPQTVEEDDGVLGPGAITAIVIAVFLGASVLLALIVITLRKFTAS